MRSALKLEPPAGAQICRLIQYKSREINLSQRIGEPQQQPSRVWASAQYFSSYHEQELVEI